MDQRTRRSVLGALGGGVVALSGCLSDGGDGDGGSNGGNGGGSDASTEWRTETLTDVTTGEQFTVSELEPPALVHPFAIWCSTCSSQNRELDRLQQEREQELEIVQLNIGDGENDDDVLTYAEDNGYADRSRFAVAPNSVADGLVDEFGPTAVSPPQSPVILVCQDGSVHEIDKVTGAAAVGTEIETNCG